MATAAETKPLNVQVPVLLKKKLDIQAIAEDRNLRMIVIDALTEYLENHPVEL
ncbi:hypothetical protein [Glutamicibacter sp. FBE19]|uniref:hypothetical protein n=1 Tax=Glutamicibacter sp. FBE19 TaxID=2761534 RepID=UPI0018969114|nr:hypothetical protein [Glutamicibacter sp. FBE19]MBF6671154.1 hypothetical protein [Glutamicibacter sp. FBE19]